MGQKGDAEQESFGIDWIECGWWVMSAMGADVAVRIVQGKNTNIWGFSVCGSEILSCQWAARSLWEEGQG